MAKEGSAYYYVSNIEDGPALFYGKQDVSNKEVLYE